MEFAAGVAVTRDITLVRPLREGAMGRVWIAKHTKLGREVAVKFMAEKMAKDRAMVSRFTREAEAASQISSPHVVKILEHGTTDEGTPFIAMELLAGETLGDRLGRENSLSFDLATSVLRQVGNALDAAHARGIVHRDIKPDNLFLVGGGEYPVVKVLDFGMAKRMRQRSQSIVTATGVAVGTPEYMSPEQVLGAKDVDFRSDLWALAVVAYNMITGEAAFEATTPHALFFTICKGSFTPLSRHDAPLDLEPWFHRAFQPSKEKRFGSAREMVLRFEACLSAARADDDDESTQMIPPADRLRVLESFGKGGPESQTNPRFESPPDSGSIDHLASTLDFRAGDIDDDDSEDDSVPTQLVSKGDAAQAIRGALRELGNPMGTAPDSQTTLRAQPKHDDDFKPDSHRTATIDLGDNSSGFDKTVHSNRNPFELLEDSGSSPPPDESVPGLAKPRPRQPSDAPDSYPDVTDADASGPRPALASHSPDSSGARISVSARTAGAIAAKAAREAPGATADEGVQRAEPARAPRKPNALITVGGLTAVAAVVIFIVTTRSPNSTGTTSAAQEPPATTEAPAATAPAPEPVVAAPAAPTAPTKTAAAAADDAVGTLTIVCSPQCINIRLGEEILGPSPLMRREVPAGTLQLTLLRQGMSPSVVEVEVAAGQHVTRSFNLNAPAAEPDPAPVAPPPASGPAPEPKAVVDDPYANETLPIAPGETPPPPLPVGP